MTVATAFGKVILFGEHAVVYGRPAIAAAIDRGAEASASKSAQASSHLTIEPWQISVTAAHGEQSEQGEHAAIARAFAALLEACGAPYALEVRARAEIAAGAGLGCSAALAVAIVRAIDGLFERERSLDQVVETSLAWERVFHGNPSGIDSVLAARGGVVRFVRGEPIKPIVPREALTFVVASSGQSASTKAMVESVAKQRARQPERVDQALAAIEAIVNNAELAMTQGDARALGQLLDMNHSLLAGLMLSTTRLEELIRVARDHGALGAKLTGSGGGGAIIALAPKAEDARARLIAALRAESDEVFEVSLR